MLQRMHTRLQDNVLDAYKNALITLSDFNKWK